MKQYIKYFYLIILLTSFFFGYNLNQEEKITKNSQKEVVSAFLRVKNEIKTIKACLESIDGVFNRIVIIHSNEPDDGSVAFMNDWCSKRNYCEIHEYPHFVIPSHNTEYQKGTYAWENTLAAYYNFGLQFFGPEEWVVKIDGDQIYLKEKLKEFINPFQNGEMDENKSYGLTGYNTFIRKNELVLYKKGPINGGMDSFIVKRKHFNFFNQTNYYEVSNISVPYSKASSPVWFHFMKSLKSAGIIRNNDDAQDDEIAYLSVNEKELFERNIRPLLNGGSYYHISIPTANTDYIFK